MGLKLWLSFCVALSVVSGSLAAAKRGNECSEDIVSTSVLPLLRDISAEIQHLRQFKTSLEEMLPILANISPLLNNISSEIQLLKRQKTPKSDKATLEKPNDRQDNVECSSGPDAAQFTTSPHYGNTRLVSSLVDAITTITTEKKTSSKNCASVQCSQACANSQSCHAFNFYESGASYVCELMPDNLCRNTTKLAFVNWPGGNVWEKKASAASLPCVDAMLGADAKISCDVLRPGCEGTWPNCHSCLKNCDECSDRFLYYFSDGECTYWPDADVPHSMPIFGRCSSMYTYLATRKVDYPSGEVTRDFRMASKDIHRLSKLHSHRQLQFWFKTTDYGDWFWFSYNNWVVGEDGTLSNLTFAEKSENAQGDIFNLNGAALKPTPFVTVADDRYGCGSFWLLNSKNATYCPGGEVGMFGTVKFDGNRALSTGISTPQSIKDRKTLVAASIQFSN